MALPYGIPRWLSVVQKAQGVLTFPTPHSKRRLNLVKCGNFTGFHIVSFIYSMVFFKLVLLDMGQRIN